MKYGISISLVAIFLIIPVWSQQPEAKNSPDIFKVLTTSVIGQGGVEVFQDEQVKALFMRYNDSRRTENKIPGYRMRIFSNSGQTARSNAYGEKARFLKSFPDIVTYIVFETPNWKVYVGDFRDRVEAFRAYKQISKEFKNAFVVPARINLPKI